eukprot:3355446-Pyramimonas_sp.AAC.1
MGAPEGRVCAQRAWQCGRAHEAADVHAVSDERGRGRRDREAGPRDQQVREGGRQAGERQHQEGDPARHAAERERERERERLA